MQSVLPPQLMVSEPGSYAEYTIVKRKPQILRRIALSRMFGQEVINRLADLDDEITGGVVKPITEQFIDTALWKEAWGPHEGKTWRELPWFFAECYFYRRVLEITGYFQPGDGHRVDPFTADKREALAHGMADITSIVKFVPPDLTPEERLTLWLHRSLWGNRADLSNREVLEQTRIPGDATRPRMLLIDHTAEVLRRFYNGQARQVEFICDNAGLELISDLFLADELLSQNLVDRVVLNLKPCPFFVSDAMLEDVASTLSVLQNSPDERISSVQSRLDKAALTGKMRITTHPFWITPYHFNDLPGDLHRQLASANLLILKGDVNYRRLLEDRHWPPTADLAAIARRMPASFVTLRTLKSEIIVGLDEGVAEATASQDKDWLTNGERGIVHLVALPG